MNAVTEMVKTYPIKRVCEVLEVSRSMYWRYWKKVGKVVPTRMDAVEIFEKSRWSYGSRRLAAALGKRGYDIGRYAVRSLMKDLNPKAKHVGALAPRQNPIQGKRFSGIGSKGISNPA